MVASAGRVNDLVPEIALERIGASGRTRWTV
jgi:hypothetical protein